MIITHIIGGLGNQMFQYAAGRALALARGGELTLDLRDYAGYGLHNGFELDRVFACPASAAVPGELRSVLGWRAGQLALRLLRRRQLAFLRGPRLVVEPYFYFWPGLAQAPEPCYLAGYWQSEKYFAAAAETIRADFSFKQPLTGRNLEVAAQIRAVSAVSLHIRRGDYVRDPKTSATLGTCAPDYYQAAATLLAERQPEAEFFVFSDDIAWAKEHLGLTFPCHYMDQNHGTDSHFDMQLMSLCRHNITANSSFSWWGAWLNRNPGKIVVAPRRWFAGGQLQDKDLVPPGWERM